MIAEHANGAIRTNCVVSDTFDGDGIEVLEDEKDGGIEGEKGPFFGIEKCEWQEHCVGAVKRDK
ncbi:hypothetical protein [Acidisphaera sp. S103]|uniref:hypothetical protein n=1 Tax=Acidisphaera sp. S103 TaxID=1747223 RepID=UPI00131E7CE0|nr:hypothetical protein [Acidisphaera sp. S103]